MFWLLDTVWTDVVLGDPVDRSVVDGVPPVVSGPPPDWAVVVGIPYLGTLVVVEEPPGVVSDHLGEGFNFGQRLISYFKRREKRTKNINKN